MSDATMPVFIVRTWDAVPVFHAPGGATDAGDVDNGDGTFTRRFKVRTLCGEVTGESATRRNATTLRVLPGTDHYREYAVRLRYDHAVKFGRPCKKCEHAGGFA